MTSTKTSTTAVAVDPATHRVQPAYFTGLPELAHWHARAACGDEPAEAFFLSGRLSERQMVRVERARRICASCPVIAECLDRAETMPEPFGIWGGTTPRERGWNAWGKRVPSHRAPRSASL
ncbi:WhiB family transcriptional regulator [Streptomyces sp. T-3]|nr:WhiB family transcriptional regulator [Streptomyces sp. T-3]